MSSVMQSAPGPAPGAQEPTGSGTSPQPGSGNGDVAANYKDKPAAGGPADSGEGAKARRQSEGAPAPVIPEFCSPGVFSRTLLLVHLGVLAVLGASVSLWDDGNRALDTLFYLLTIFEPSMLLAMLLLCLARKKVNGLSQRMQWVLGLLIPGAIGGVVSLVVGNVQRVAAGEHRDAYVPLLHDALGAALCAVLVAGGVYRYFRLRGRAYAPSFSEARLQALQARIRPHFLFNSLNTVLGLIRSNPKLAESTLENLADLLAKQLEGGAVDWDAEFAKPLMIGVNAFRTYVDGWYDFRFQNVVYAPNRSPEISRMISSILAGYAWDTENPFVAKSEQRLSTLAALVGDLQIE